MKKVMWRVIPILILCYFAAFVDRTNVSFASLTMNKELGFSSAVYGLAAGIFFWGIACLRFPAISSSPEWARGSGSPAS